MRIIASKLICSVDDCDEPGYSVLSGNSLCRKHQARWRRYGDTSVVKITPPGVALEWIKSLVEEVPDGQCRFWPFDRKSKQKPIIVIDGKNFIATHLSLMLAGQERPQAPYNNALHSCDNEMCCAPWHLRWGTIAENNQDIWDRGRSLPQKHEKLIAWLDEHGIEFPEEMR